MDGQQQTRAEAYAEWVTLGHTFAQCNQYWAQIKPEEVGPGKIRDLDPDFATAERERLKESLSQQKASIARSSDWT